MSMKKIIALAFTCITVLFTLVGCGTPTAEEINSSVKMPDVYNIEYSIEYSDGTIQTVKKTVDNEGNIYFLSGEKELLFVKNENNYALYEREESGMFTETDPNKSYNLNFVNEQTAEFTEYAEYTKKQFLPTSEKKGTVSYLNRSCNLYELIVGFEGTGVKYEICADTETGICMYYKVKMNAFGIELPSDDIEFSCTVFQTENIEPLIK